VIKARRKIVSSGAYLWESRASWKFERIFGTRIQIGFGTTRWAQIRNFFGDAWISRYLSINQSSTCLIHWSAVEDLNRMRERRAIGKIVWSLKVAGKVPRNSFELRGRFRSARLGSTKKSPFLTNNGVFPRSLKFNSFWDCKMNFKSSSESS